jgi:bacterial/archaeal transporter family-2 protein
MNANAGWIIPFIIMGGALQSCGAAMNGRLNKHVVNPWLASAISFALITFFFASATLIHPQPLPTQKDLAELPWSAVVGGLVGAVQVYAGLTLVNKVGAGPFVGFTVTADRSLRLVSNATASFDRRTHRWRPGSGRRLALVAKS